MSIFLYILGNNIIPIFIIIGLGFLLGKKFDLNVSTISKLSFYIFVPAFLFYNLYTTDLNSSMLKVLVFSIFFLISNDLLSRIIAKIFKYDLALTNVFKNSIMFNNCGNIGVSLITLIFSSGIYLIDGNTPYLSQALPAQIMLVVFTNITLNTVGFYNAGRGKMNLKDSVRQMLGMPSIYVVILAFLLKYAHVDITPIPIWTAIKYISGGLVPVSLIGLGVQLSQAEFDFTNIDVYIAVFTRLVLGPIFALLFIYVFGFSGVLAQTLLIAYSVPTAVNTALIAVECDNNANFASQTVMISTIFSAVTLTAVIYFAGILFPV